MEPAAILLFQIESKTKAGGIDPTLADLLQEPSSVPRTQGVCHFLQAWSMAGVSETIPLFGELDGLALLSLGLAGHVFVSIQNHLGGEGWVSTHADGQVAPVGVHDMEVVMIDVGPGFLPFDGGDLAFPVLLHLPHGCGCPPHQNQKEARFDSMISQVILYG